MTNTLHYYKDVLCEDVDDALESALAGKSKSLQICCKSEMNMVPDTIKLLKPYLEELRLDNNYNLIATGPNIGELHLLRLLDIRYCALIHVHKTLGKLIRLEELLLSNNSLSFIPWEIRHLRNLRVLRLDSNKLSVLPGTLLRLAQLAELEIENNRLLSPEEAVNVKGEDVVAAIRERYKEDWVKLCSSSSDAAQLICPEEEVLKEVDCDSCCLRSRNYQVFVQTHNILDYKQLPFLHFVCSEDCRRNLAKKLDEYDQAHS